VVVEVSARLPEAKALAVVPPTKVIVPAPIEGEVVPVVVVASGVVELKSHPAMMAAFACPRPTRQRIAIRFRIFFIIFFSDLFAYTFCMFISFFEFFLNDLNKHHIPQIC